MREDEERDPWWEIAFLSLPPASCYSDSVLECMKLHRPPYRATNFGKGPWVVVGSRGFNMLGNLLFSEGEAQFVADVLNRAASVKEEANA